MKQSENKIVIRMKEDYIFRTFIFSAGSFLITFVFTIYNIFLAFVYRAAWNIGISVYYALLLCIRAYVIFSEYRLYKHEVKEKEERIRKNLFLTQSILLLIIDLALIAPITMMVLQEKEIHYSEIPAITIATYTCYKIIMSSRNYIKTRKTNYLSVRTIRNVNFIDALVSVLSLQYTLIMTFSAESNKDMLGLTATSSFIIWAFIVVISILNLRNAIKIKKQ